MGLFLVAAVVLAHRWRETARTDALRVSVVGRFDRDVAALARRFQSLRARIEGWTVRAAREEPATRVVAGDAPRFERVQAESGVYLRLPRSEAATSSGVMAAAADMDDDAIVRCLGIAPVSAKDLYGAADVLAPGWIAAVRRESNRMRLRVFDEQLSQREKLGLDTVRKAVGAGWFMLVLEHGENRRDYPVDVFLWDLRADVLWLSAHIQANGILIPASIGLSHARAMAPRPVAQSGAAHDCSIAAQIRDLMAATAPVPAPAAD